MERIVLGYSLQHYFKWQTAGGKNSKFLSFCIFGETDMQDAFQASSLDFFALYMGGKYPGISPICLGTHKLHPFHFDTEMVYACSLCSCM